jgi:hypothetical protein
MKIKFIIFLLLINGCSGKDQFNQYLMLEFQYNHLLRNINYVIEDTQNSLEIGIILSTELNEHQVYESKKVTDNDRTKLNEIISNAEHLKVTTEAILQQCKLLIQLSKSKNIFNNKNIQRQIDSKLNIIRSSESYMLKITGGVKPNEYIAPFVPKDMK